MKRKTKVIIGVGAVGAVLAVAAVARASNGEDEARALENTVLVEQGDIVDKALAVGTIEPKVEISVKSILPGVVNREFADEGDFVRAGVALLEIKPNPTPLELVEARRGVELREIELDNAQTELDRQKELLAKNLIAQQDYDNAEQRFAEATLQLTTAQERLGLLEEGRVNVASGRIETVVKSPIDGFILEKSVEIGDPVVPLTPYQEGTVLLRMAAMKDLIFRGTVDEIDVGRLEEGMPVEIKIGALPEAKVKGVLEKISLKARKQDQATVFPIEIALTEAEGVVLRAGYSANADVIIEQRESVLVIPERLVEVRDDTARVTVMLADGTTELRVIKTGLSDAINVEVVEGLAEGERLVEKPPREIQ
jgi:HlyD family secretion protein